LAEAERKIEQISEGLDAAKDAQEAKEQLIAALADAEDRERQRAGELAQTRSDLEMSQSELAALSAQFEDFKQASFLERRRMVRQGSNSVAPQPVSNGGEGEELLRAMLAGDRGRFAPDGRIVSTAKGAGCLCYGPYIDLSAGRYSLELEFERPSFSMLDGGSLVIEIVDGATYLSSHVIQLQPGTTRPVVAFEVPSAERPRQIEFRIMLTRRTRVSILSIRLVHED
jgi:hypothetical protein